MKHCILPLLFGVTLVCVTVNTALTYSNSAPPTGMTNAPGEMNCTSCHTDFSLNTSGSLYNNISLSSTVPFSSFQQNTTYTLQLHFENVSSTKYGFEMVALPENAGSGDGSVGEFSSTNQTTEVNTSGNREYISHSSIGTSAPTRSKTWDFEWKTPSTYNGDVDFYVVINSSNGNGTNGGDVIIAKVFSATVLPVKWLSSSIKPENNDVLVCWSTASELNNNLFEVERSKDAQTWETTGTVKGKGNSNMRSDYRFIDANAVEFGFKYYRIKQVDYDGKFSHSIIMALGYEAKNKLYNIVYNISEKRIYLNNITTNAFEPISLYNIKGETIMKNVITDYIDASTLQQGIYFVSFADGSISKKVFVY